MEQLRQRVERLKYENHQLEEMLANAEEQVGDRGWEGIVGGAQDHHFIRQ
jgi:predicted nuclease with TOPRIM domain